jgi:hypothetical protein
MKAKNRPRFNLQSQGLWAPRAGTCGRGGRWIVERSVMKRPFVSECVVGWRLAQNHAPAPETGANRGSSRWPGAGRTRQRLRSAVALHRFGTRPRWPTKATMVCSLVPCSCASRETFTHSHGRGKSNRSLVGKICVGPKLQRTGALHDASRRTVFASGAPASSECGGPPPLWNASSLANQSHHGLFARAVFLREP